MPLIKSKLKQAPSDDSVDESPSLSVALGMKRRASKPLPTPSMPSSEHEEHYSSIADAILGKARKAKMMADGGMVDIDSNEEESLHDGDPGLEVEDFGEHADSLEQPEDSNEHGDDMASIIMKKMRSKKGS